MMYSAVVLSCFLAVTTAFPKDLPVVRPNHFLQQGTFGKEQHLLPETFYTPGQQIESELRGLNIVAVPQQENQGTLALQESASSDVDEQRAAVGSSAEASSDSYANIGGASGRIASSLTNTNEYGEQVPKAFSNLEQDSYAFYHNYKA